MADGTINIDEPAVADKLLDTEELTVGANTVQRERVQIAGAGATQICPVDATKGLRVDLANTGANATAIKVDGSAATQPVSGTVTATIAAGATTIAKAEDAAHSSGDVGVMLLAVREATATDLSAGNTDGDYEPLQVSATGRLWTSATIDAALPAGTNAIGKLAANSGVDIGDVDVTSLPSLPAGANAIGKLTANSGVTIGAVEIAAAQTLATVTTVSTVTAVTGSGVAHDGADAGNPHKIGAKAETSPKGITAVADGDRTDLYADSDGLLMVKLNTSGADRVSERVSNTDGNSTAFSNFGAVASTFNNVTGYSVFRTDAGTSLAYVDFRDGTAGAILWSVPLPPNGGVTLSSASPLFRTSANTALAFDVSAALTTVYLSVAGFQSKV